MPALPAEHGRHSAPHEVSEVVLLANIDGNFRAGVDDTGKVVLFADVAGREVVAVEHFLARESGITPHVAALHHQGLVHSAALHHRGLVHSAALHHRGLVHSAAHHRGLRRLRSVEGRLRAVGRRRLRRLLSFEISLFGRGLFVEILVHELIAPKNFFATFFFEVALFFTGAVI